MVPKIGVRGLLSDRSSNIGVEKVALYLSTAATAPLNAAAPNLGGLSFLQSFWGEGLGFEFGVYVTTNKPPSCACSSLVFCASKT